MNVDLIYKEQSLFKKETQKELEFLDFFFPSVVENIKCPQLSGKNRSLMAYNFNSLYFFIEGMKIWKQKCHDI